MFRPDPQGPTGQIFCSPDCDYQTQTEQASGLISTPHNRVITTALTPWQKGRLTYLKASILGASHIYTPQIFMGLRQEPHRFPCNSIHWTTVFYVGQFSESIVTTGQNAGQVKMLMIFCLVSVGTWRKKLRTTLMLSLTSPNIRLQEIYNLQLAD